MRLGDGFYIPVVDEPTVEVRQPSFEDLRNEQLLVAIAALQDALLNMPRPEVHVEAPDLSAIVTAVTGLKPGATSEDIAQAVVRELNPATPQTEVNEVLSKLVKALEKLDFRMSGGAGSGGSVALASSNITDNPFRQLGVLNHTVDNPVPVDIQGATITGGSFTPTPSVSSTKNNPTVPLAANEMFVGDWEDVLQFAAIQVAILTDAPSVTNGAVIEFSTDMVNVIRSVPTTIPANFGAYFHLSPEARYVRLRYTNGPTAQTLLRLSVQFSYTTPADVVQPLASTITDANVATVVRSHLAGRQATGQWSPVAVSSAGRLSVDTQHAQSLTDAQLRSTPVPVSGSLLVPRATDAVASGTVQAVNSAVMLVTSGSVSSFSFDVGTFTSGTFVIERTLAPDPTAAGALWTVVGAFKAGTRTSRGTWSESGAFHGNASASSAVRIRVTVALNVPATVNLLASSGTGTVTIGAIASNEGNVIGAVQDLGQHYATTAGGNASWNSSTDFLSMSSTGELPVATLTNPAGSGVDMFVLGYELSGSAITQWRRYRNATLSALGAAQDAVNRGGDTAKVSLGKVYRGAGSTSQATAAQFARTGGTLGKATVIGANVPHEVDLNGEVRLRPGQNWVFTATGPGGLGGTMTVSFFADWFEIAAS